MKLPQEVFDYYDKMMKSVQQMHRGILIDRLGNVLWQEDYGAWQLRIKEIVPERPVRPTPPPVREYDHSFGVDVPLPRCDDWHNVNRFTDD